MVVKPLLQPGDKVIDTETGKPYKIEGERAYITKGGVIYGISLFQGHTDLPGFQPGTYQVVRKGEKEEKPQKAAKKKEPQNEDQPENQEEENPEPDDEDIEKEIDEASVE